MIPFSLSCTDEDDKRTMTAEIALMNRSALALAADSAVTLRIGDNQKTYNTAEKIFEFSCRQPIALMLYNNAEFAGVPFDVLVRAHRKNIDREYNTLEEAAEQFINYISQFDEPNIYEKKYALEVFAEEYGRISEQFLTEISHDMATPTSRPASNPSDILRKMLKEAIDEAEANNLDGYLADKNIEEFIDRYGDVCIKAANLKFWMAADSKSDEEQDDQDDQEAGGVSPAVGEDNPVTKNIDLLYRLAFAIIKSIKLSHSHTGLVFGGFGNKDLFPSLYSFEIDGIYFGEPKILNRNSIKIDRGQRRASIVAFAQSEMVERFINGIDNKYIDITVSYLTSVVDTIFNAAGLSKDKNLSDDVKSVVVDNFRDTAKNLRSYEQKSMLDTVSFMSKKELAEMAHALVELTSAKRRFSMDLETVGGPIDVAIVSRSEGLVWIRRKNYFERDMNPGFFHRVFPATR